MGGGAFVDSFDSSRGMYVERRTQGQARVGVTGNINLISSKSISYGRVFALNTNVGSCRNGVPGIRLSGGAQVTEGYVRLPSCRAEISSSGRYWEPDQVAAVGDPTHMFQLRMGDRGSAGEGRACGPPMTRGCVRRCGRSGSRQVSVRDRGHSRTAPGRDTLAASCRPGAPQMGVTGAHEARSRFRRFPESEDSPANGTATMNGDRRPFGFVLD